MSTAAIITLISTLVGLVTTTVLLGVKIGNLITRVKNLEDKQDKTEKEVYHLSQNNTNIQVALGVISTKIDNIMSLISEIKKDIDKKDCK